MTAWRRNTLPRQARHSMRSKAGRRSRRMTPATKLFGDVVGGGGRDDQPKEITIRRGSREINEVLGLCLGFYYETAPMYDLLIKSIYPFVGIIFS